MHLFTCLRLLKQNTVALSFYQKCLGIEQSQVTIDGPIFRGRLKDENF